MEGWEGLCPSYLTDFPISRTTGILERPPPWRSEELASVVCEVTDPVVGSLPVWHRA
jgi:hypothetical protein